MPLKIVQSLDPVRSSFKSKGYSLLPHQEKAVRWMSNREEKKIKGGILADEMGVGKTIETIGLMMFKPVSHTLIIVPASLILQWKKEIDKFSSGFNVSIHGFNKKTADTNIVITSFVKSTYEHLADFRWDRVIIDEAHIIRNPKGKIYKKICKLNSKIKWCLTGTPIQNYLSDIHSLFTFIGIKKKKDVKSTINKYLFRRTKEDVNIKLGGYQHFDHMIEFDTLYEKQLYRKVRDNIYDKINIRYLEMLLRLRQAAILPQLVLDGYDKKKKKRQNIQWKYKNSKISKIIEMLEDKPDEKPVVFCYFKREIQYLAEQMETKGISYNIIQGSVELDERQRIIVCRQLGFW